jgi:Domain of unknown function (DUF1905)
MKTKKGKTYKVSGKVWLYPGESANWHFFTIPKKESSELKDAYKGLTKGWGSLPVEVTIGKTTWKTSIFPDSKSGTFILPIKAMVRKREEVYEGDACTVLLTVTI